MIYQIVGVILSYALQKGIRSLIALFLPFCSISVATVIGTPSYTTPLSHPSVPDS